MLYWYDRILTQDFNLFNQIKFVLNWFRKLKLKKIFKVFHYPTSYLN
jgi:hypothetical protein